jgi:hypothetical protein
MKESSARAQAFVSRAVSSEDRLERSIYQLGLVHQISLSNLADEYGPKKRRMSLFILWAAQFKYDDHEAMAKR